MPSAIPYFLKCCISRGRWLAVLMLLSGSAFSADFHVTVSDIAAPAFSAHGISLDLSADGSAELKIELLKLPQREFRPVRLRCGGFSLSGEQMVCQHGKLDALPDAALAFSYDFTTHALVLTLTAAGGESWQVQGALGAAWQLSAQMRNARVARLAGLLSQDVARPAAGRLDGSLRLAGDASGARQFSADLRVAELAFSDASGQHAAEKLQGSVGIEAQRRGAGWAWRGNLDWQSGELYWQPWYLQGAHAMQAAGRLEGDHLLIEQAQAELSGVGRVEFSADWSVQRQGLQQAMLRGEHLALGQLFDTWLKPLLGKGVLAESALSGAADVALEYRNGALQALQLGLHDAGIADATQRFALQGVNSTLDWHADQARTARISFAGGQLLGVPLGAGAWTVNMNGLDFSVPQAELAILDGRLSLQDFHCFRTGNDWRWHFAGALSPVSMERLSTAAGWPKMLGMLAGRIPQVSYDGEAVRVEGALLFDVFDGTVVATKIELANAFGRAPRLSGNLAMRNLDLDLLTRTFSFGNMQGRIDADVQNLELQDWQPLRFDARLSSSAGDYPKKISQKAVQNISSLGGAGASAALQRSFLGFFENFGYDRIGWSCVMRNGVCTMGGIGEDGGHTYTLVRGGGIPAISVMGYNRAVSWPELVTRLKRVTQNNVSPVVR
ncbi:MAG: hypothetical protein PHH47_02450 [Gallionella sp.]|nr:hypothetical protein [Gallionella sp.]MDD4946058.1 hypothetical protein [Gallionella sp.]MDD5612235.1 hypothetical protein [Gallionella sp.]